MATSPEGVSSVLDFEEKEAKILKITKELTLVLLVEESGDLEELGKMWRRFEPSTFQVLHVGGHGSTEVDESGGGGYFITKTLNG